MPPLLIHPPDYSEFSEPLIFLAGPIQGAPRWQDEAARLLGDQLPALAIANPRRNELAGAFEFDAQVDWESHHLRLAARTGLILFWLAREVEQTPGRAYAQTTRFELAEWKMRHERDGVKLVVGIEEGFSGARYIRRRLGQDCPGIPLCSSLEETCRAAVETLKTLVHG
jgi:hypothetical protein